MMYGHSTITAVEREEFDRWILAKNYGIKPWETDPDGEKYPEDCNSLLAFWRLETEAMKKEKDREASQVRMFRSGR